MVLAQVILTPAESKKLIAMAVAQLDTVKRAAKHGMIVLNYCSSNYFVVEAITGEKPKTNAWLCGVTVPKGGCLEVGALVNVLFGNKAGIPPRARLDAWVIRNGKMSPTQPMGELLDEMGPDDVYIKGANAIDMEGNVGVLVGAKIEKGSIGLMINALKKKNFNLIVPVGLEKLIPTPIREATKEAKRARYAYGMGVTTGLYPVPKAMVITEPKAIEILSGATATPVAAGGLGGAEGAIVLVIKGDNAQVNQAIKYVELSKGAQLPQVRTWNCNECSLCSFPLIGKHWAEV